MSEQTSRQTVVADPAPATAPSPEPFITVEDLVVRYGDKTVVKGVSFTIDEGQQLALLGPSGCGKTTTLRCIAGLETPASGEIRIDGRVVFSSAKRINVPTEKRELSLMFQSYAIWPHMTVFENVAYALRLRTRDRAAIRARVHEVLTMVGIADFADTPATQLSGGQQQRVALARSYAHPPKALLLDEPLSNLDARLRDQVRDDLKAFQRESGVTTIYVTHDQEEAMALSDRIIVMRDGNIVQDDVPLRVYQRPRNRFVADFIGAANILTGKLTESADGWTAAVGDAALTLTGAHDAANGETRDLAIRTVYPVVTSGERPADGSNVWPARVDEVVLLGDYLDLKVSWTGGVVRVRMVTRRELREGEDVWLHFPPESIVVLDPDPRGNPAPDAEGHVA